MQPATGGKEAPGSAAPADAGRRDFCGRTARLGGGLLLAMTVPAFAGRPAARASAGPGTTGAGAPGAPAPAEINAWLKIAPDDSITVLVDRSEMGQGVYTALPMLLAEELEVDFTTIQIVAAPVGDAYVNAGNGGQITGTSNSVTDAWEKLRTARASRMTAVRASPMDSSRRRPRSSRCRRTSSSSRRRITR
jgi:isoquinoline 1-oxidoreductase beta subunit